MEEQPYSPKTCQGEIGHSIPTDLKKKSGGIPLSRKNEFINAEMHTKLSDQELVQSYQAYCDNLPFDADEIDVFNHCIQQDIEKVAQETQLALAVITQEANRRFHRLTRVRHGI